MIQKILLCLFCFLIFNSLSTAQVKEDQEYGELLLSSGRYKEALPVFNNLLKQKPENPELNFFTGLCYFYLPLGTLRSIEYFEKSATVKSTSFYFDLRYYMGQAYHLANRFDDAVASFEIVKQGLKQNKNGKELLKDIQHRIDMCNYGKTLTLNPRNVSITNVGKGINSEYPEYAPIISADESIMIFTSRRKGSTGGLVDENGEYFEDIYSSYNTNGTWTAPVKIDSAAQANSTKPKWSRAKKLSSAINTEKHDAAIGLSSDAQKLFIYRNEDVYMSKLKGKDWGIPVKLNSAVNSKYKEPSASLSADENTLFFTSDRKGGFGGKDIYKSTKNKQGEWSTAENLGPTINTIYDEDAPFIQSDGKTLYFSSKGHTSMGGYDIFKSIFEEKWSSPENMGFPVNSAGDDIYYVVSAKGDHGYFSSLRSEGYGGMDIYYLTIEGVNIPLTEVKGLVLVGDSLKPAGARIVIVDNNTNKEVGTYSANSESGKYLLIFPPGKNYKMTVTADGFIPHVENIFIPDQKRFYQLYQEIHFQHIRAANGRIIGQKVAIENAFFDINKYIHSDSALFNHKDTASAFSAYLNFLNKNNKKLHPRDSLVYSEKNATLIYNSNDSLLLAHIEPLLTKDTINFSGDNITKSYYSKVPTKLTPSTTKQNPSLPGNKNEKRKPIEIFYQTNSFLLDSNSIKEIDDISVYLKENKKVKIRINGYTDSIGPNDYNYKLGMARAKSVRELLAKNGIENKRMEINSYGKRRQIILKDKEQSLIKNRRAELIFY
jgi:outer membrane protein OmpA-like peptidoglycan-associated protein/tetratricopeptide (TPR) repeat protein